MNRYCWFACAIFWTFCLGADIRRGSIWWVIVDIFFVVITTVKMSMSEKV